ncbi:hypothetical protein IIC65_08310, partial [Candidatus Sumerlaeota bacterium]|nr:hypothetical protein [Candidatus Sumerlaeota bacterium]
VSPDHNGTPPEIMNYFLGAVDEQSERLGVPMIAHINHPNWSGGIIAEDLMQVGPGRYFEVYNGHGGVRNWGNKQRAMPNTDRLWDIVLSMRLKDGRERPMYGFGTDDTHNYFENRVGLANAGRGWTWILAEELSAEALIEACKRGDFYASSGVTLNEITIEESRIKIVIAAQDGIRYRVQFIGTRQGFDASSKPALDGDGQPLDHATRVYSDEIGQTLHETTENPAVYEFKGDELYVRVKIISDKLQTNPFAAGDFEMAWTQPVLIR